MADCDNITVDLSPVDFDVTICSTPAFDVEIIQPDVTLEAVSIAGQGPKGDKGDQGDQGVPGTPGAAGAPGSPGTAASVNAGTTTTGAPGTNADVVNSGTSSTAIFDFTIPRGDAGATGPMGQGILIKGSVPNHASLPTTGNTPGDVWIASDTSHGWAWNGTAWVDIGPIQGPPGAVGPSGPAGSDGAPGAAGSAATVAAGPTVTSAPGTNAAVINTGTSSAAVFAFTIPRGDVGQQGPAGAPGSIGIDGAPGAPGAAGGNAWTLVTNASFTVPAYGANVTVQAGDTNWVALGEWVYIDDAGGPGVAGQLVVTSKTPTTLTLFNPTPTTYPLASTSTDGLLRKVSGLASDFIDGTNNCQPIAPIFGSMRLRSFNAIGNPNFETDQRICSAAVNPATGSSWLCDRWSWSQSLSVNRIQAQRFNEAIVVPGTNFLITNSRLRVTLATQQTTLAAADYFALNTILEGSALRELFLDVHSVSLLVRSSVANLKFGLQLTDPTNSRTLVKLCTIPTANVWTLISLPNLPVFPPSGSFSTSPGLVGYTMGITLACGTTYTTPANDVWQNSNFIAATGQSNFLASPVNSTFDIAFVQHEPGPLCTTLMDKPFSQNLDECLRYYTKTWNYGQAPGISSQSTMMSVYTTAAQFPYGPFTFPKIMAKAPTVVAYNPYTANRPAAVYDTFAAVERAVTSYTGVGERGFSCPVLSTTNAGVSVYQFHYTADAGW